MVSELDLYANEDTTPLGGGRVNCNVPYRLRSESEGDVIVYSHLSTSER